MADDHLFESYQGLRASAEAGVRDSVRAWAFSEAPPDMTVGQLKNLSDTMTRQINHHTRQVFDMMRGAVKD